MDLEQHQDVFSRSGKYRHRMMQTMQRFNEFDLNSMERALKGTGPWEQRSVQDRQTYVIDRALAVLDRNEHYRRMYASAEEYYRKHFEDRDPAAAERHARAYAARVAKEQL